MDSHDGEESAVKSCDVAGRWWWSKESGQGNKCLFQPGKVIYHPTKRRAQCNQLPAGWTGWFPQWLWQPIKVWVIDLAVGILKTQLWWWAGDEVFVAEPVPSLHACHGACWWAQVLGGLGSEATWDLEGSDFTYLSPNHLRHSWDFLMYIQCWICRGPILRVVLILANHLQCFPFNVSGVLAKPLVRSHESLQIHTAGPLSILVSQDWEFFCHKKYFGRPLVCVRMTWLCGVS